MKSRKTLAVILPLVFVLLSIPLHASAIEKEHIFTYEELACMDYVPAEECIMNDVDTLIPINNIENSSKGTTTYYIIECADGYMLTNPSGTTFSRTRYNSGSLQYKKWNFTEDSSGNLIVYSYSNPTKCLTVNPTTKTVSLSTYSSSSNYQKWKMYYSSNGNALKCVSSDSSVNGYKLVISGSTLSVSSSTYTLVGFFNVSWYVPTTALSYSNFYLAPQQSKYVYPNKTPSNANCTNSWINWSSSNTSRMTVDSGGKATGVSAGSATLTFRDRITRVYGTCTVNVTQIPNGTYFLKNKENSQYAKIKNGTMTNGQNVVQYDLDGKLSERWVFTLNTSTGYYSIKSANSGSTAYYMAVSDDSSAINKPIVIRSATESTLTDGMKWRVSTTSSGAYKITPKTGEANDYVLCTKTIFGFNNWNLVQSDYVLNSSYCDEWYIIRMLPTNGYELSYNASSWAGVPSSNCNCYAYAINNQVKEPTGNQIWFKQQPGEYYNIHRGNATAIPQGLQSPPSIIVSAVTADFNKYNSINGANVTFTPIGRYEVCPSGTYKVALVVSSSDYHWYRQDSDGLWSHKRGLNPVKRTDESGNLIIDPYIADRDDYTTFVGYYAVKPWNNMYVSAKGNEVLDTFTTDNEIDEAILSSVTVGMSLNSVIEHTGSFGEDIGSGVLIQKYISNNKSTYIFEYESVCGNFVVKSITIKGE